MMSQYKKIYRRFLAAGLGAALVALCVVSYSEACGRLPDEIRIVKGKEQDISLQLPATGTLYPSAEAVSAAGIQQSNIPADSIHIQLDKTVTFVSGQPGSYTMECKLFGLIPLKTVNFTVVEDRTLIPAGIPIGIYVKTSGVLVVGTGAVHGLDGVEYEPVFHLLQSGDYIESIDGVAVEGKQDLIDRIKGCGGRELVLGIRRDGNAFNLKVSPVQTGVDEYKIGIWVRSDTQGIGTLTFLDEENRFGALGHGINDVDTSTLMQLGDGTLYNTDIISITPGTDGAPGELTGVIDYQAKNVIGKITGNTAAGIFGSGNEQLVGEVPAEALPVGLKQEIKIGPAEIISTVDGETKRYGVEITKVDYGAQSVNRGIVLEVTDERLLSVTGGIVQGMSGSPIIQDGKIIGAVTHVFVQDSAKGYGIFIENMLAAMEEAQL